MKTGAYLQQRGYPPPGFDGTGRGCRYLAQDFQQGTLASTVFADNTEYLSFFYLEIDILQSPDVFALAPGRPVIGLSDLEIGVFFSAQAVPPAIEIVRERSRPHLPQAVLLTKMFYFDYCLQRLVVS